MDNEPEARLNELTKEEFREVAKILAPHWTDEQFDAEWADFCEFKRRKAAH